MNRTLSWLLVSGLFLGASLAHGEKLFVAGALLSSIGAIYLFTKETKV